jgi:hypothetical protein
VPLARRAAWLHGLGAAVQHQNLLSTIGAVA